MLDWSRVSVFYVFDNSRILLDANVPCLRSADWIGNEYATYLGAKGNKGAHDNRWTCACLDFSDPLARLDITSLRRYLNSAYAKSGTVHIITRPHGRLDAAIVCVFAASIDDRRVRRIDWSSRDLHLSK